PINESVKDYLLFIHAWSGCDTVSAAFGKGKVSFLNLVKHSEELQEISNLMNHEWATQNEVGHAAETVFRIMYNGKEGDTLTTLRFRKYMEMVMKGVMEPEKMPPTERAAYFHGLRVHHQILVWKLLYNDPINWGYKLKD
ncbi:unnamed protein product, partial [Meganyctiphanes norvegica]